MLHISYGDISLDIEYNEKCLREYFPSKASQNLIDSLCKKSNEQARAESLCAYLNLGILLSNNGIDTKCLDISKTADGKPYFENSDVFFSISHTDKYFAVAIADSEVGIDIESKDMSEEKRRSIAKRFFLPDEAEQVSDRDSFLRIWTFKEAYAKMTGLPLPRAINKVSVFNGGINKSHEAYNEAIICICLKEKSR